MEPSAPPKQNLRGMNKPKCIQCGNVARSRCPFQSCKGCCSKAQNPCHIHVLKQSTSTLPDKPPPSASPLPEQPSSDVHSKGASSLRLSSLRQHSSNVANNLRSRKPLSRKDAISINKWRFSKLREHMEGEVDTENEAFDRYMQNVRLLEETLSINRMAIDGTAKDKTCGTATEEGHDSLISATKAKLRCSTARSQSNLDRTQALVDTLLKELQDRDKDEEEEAQQVNEGDDSKVKRRKILMLRAERTAAEHDLLDRLIRARTDDDLKSCVEIKRKLYGEHANKGNPEEDSGTQVLEDGEGTEVSETAQASFIFSFPKLWAPLQVKKDLSDIEAPLSSINDVIQL